jgi:hypothetical protein
MFEHDTTTRARNVRASRRVLFSNNPRSRELHRPLGHSLSITQHHTSNSIGLDQTVLTARNAEKFIRNKVFAVGRASTMLLCYHSSYIRCMLSNVTVCPGIAMFAYTDALDVALSRDATSHCGSRTKAKNKLC